MLSNILIDKDSDNTMHHFIYKGVDLSTQYTYYDFMNKLLCNLLYNLPQLAILLDEIFLMKQLNCTIQVQVCVCVCDICSVCHAASNFKGR